VNSRTPHVEEPPDERVAEGEIVNCAVRALPAQVEQLYAAIDGLEKIGM